MSLKSPLARVLGLGSAKEGVSHWWWQRITSIVLIPLGVWFVYSILALLPADYEQATAWLHSPVQAALFILFCGAMFWHAFLGLQVIIEDYVHTEWLKITLLIGAKLALALMLTITVLITLRIFLNA